MIDVGVLQRTETSSAASVHRRSDWDEVRSIGMGGDPAISCCSSDLSYYHETKQIPPGHFRGLEYTCRDLTDPVLCAVRPVAHPALAGDRECTRRDGRGAGNIWSSRSGLVVVRCLLCHSASGSGGIILERSDGASVRQDRFHGWE